jgi:putative ABC transport system permease protein
VVTSVLFSIAPALHYLRPDLAGALRQTSGTASRQTQIFRKAAVGVQIALSVLLLGGAGLFVRTLTNLRNQPVGFDTRHMATFGLDPTSSGYSANQTLQIVSGALDAIRKIPGVTMAAANIDPELMNDTEWNGYIVEGHKFAEGEQNDFESPYVTPGYFATIRQPLLVGRDFTVADAVGAPKVAIVNLAFAKKFYGSAANALGRLIGEDEGDNKKTKADTTIVGVVGDVKHSDLRSDMGPGVYQAYLQKAQPVGVQVYVRTVQDPETAETAIRKAIHDMDPTLVVDGLRTMEAQVDISAADERALAMLALGFAALAALLAAVGLYGVLAFSTQIRTREIGVRLALGSPRSRVVGLVVREMAWIAAVAIVVALPGTVGLAHFFQSQLYGVSPWDPETLAAALGLALLMVALAAAIPAQRATAVEPMVALRNE